MESESWRRGGGGNASYMSFTEADIDAAEEKTGSEYKEVPDIAAQFISTMYQAFNDRNTVELHQLYEQAFSTISERYFKAVAWPSAEVVGEYYENDVTFGLLYKELYYRHMFSKMSPSLNHRVDSWSNYCLLFERFLNDGFVDLDLPCSWLWDMIDEFIYQFENWCQYRSKLTSKSQQEIEYLKENEEIWSVRLVLQLLHYLVLKSNIISWLVNHGPIGSNEPDDDNFDVSSLSVYRYIGYFSIIGLLRVNTLLGDYRLALIVLQPLQFEGITALFTHVTACNVSVYYYMGFAYIMLRRYEDAARVFSSTVIHIGRIKHNHTRSYQYEQINKRIDQMMSLLALCIAFKPQHVDESTMAMIRERAGERLQRLRQGEPQVFEEMFNYASPKFVNPAPPDYDTVEDTNMEAAKLQSRLFMEEVKAQLVLPDIRSYLKLYTTIEIEKLAKLMDVDLSEATSSLHALKHKSWTFTGDFESAPLEGDFATSSDVAFYVDNNLVHISDVKQASRYGEYFINNISKLDDLSAVLKRKVTDGGGRNTSKYNNSRRTNRIQ